MKKYSLVNLIALVGTALAIQGCTRTGSDVWEDTKSAGRHLGRSVRSLGGDTGCSRQVMCRDDFECIDDENCYPEGNFADCDYAQQVESDFVPLQDQANTPQPMARQARETPGEPGSSIPGIEAFRDPSTNPQLAAVFQSIYFDYDSSLIKGQKNLQVLHNIADYMRRNPNTYVFVEGHTDERGPQSYNFALGSRRSNSVRNLLLSDGVNPDNLFTVSYGKDRPAVMESHEEGWSRNRRAEFKVYVR